MLLSRGRLTKRARAKLKFVKSRPCPAGLEETQLPSFLGLLLGIHKSSRILRTAQHEKAPPIFSLSLKPLRCCIKEEFMGFIGEEPCVIVAQVNSCKGI